MAAFSVSVPDVPVTVIVYLPAGTDAPTVIVTVLVVAVGLGAKAIVTPTGAPEDVNVTDPAKLPNLVTVIVAVPAVP